MWTPLSRTPICLDTVCCRLDNRNISLGETGTTNQPLEMQGASGTRGPARPDGTSGHLAEQDCAPCWRLALRYSSYRLSLDARDMSYAQSVSAQSCLSRRG